MILAYLSSLWLIDFGKSAKVILLGNDIFFFFQPTILEHLDNLCQKQSKIKQKRN